MDSEDRARYCRGSEVMGYHIYQDIWEARHGEILGCFRETGNIFDRAVRYHLKFAYHDTIVRVSRYILGIDTSHDMAYMR